MSHKHLKGVLMKYLAVLALVIGAATLTTRATAQEGGRRCRGPGRLVQERRPQVERE